MMANVDAIPMVVLPTSGVQAQVGLNLSCCSLCQGEKNEKLRGTDAGRKRIIEVSCQRIELGDIDSVPCLHELVQLSPDKIHLLMYHASCYADYTPKADLTD